MLFLAPILIGVGAFITVAMQPFVSERLAAGDAVLMAWIGAVILCLGLVFLAAGITLVGIRSLLLQQLDLLRVRDTAQRGE